MINFRFHLVSLIAVFLALGVGILVGSTVVDQQIVNHLDNEIRRVGKENSARESESKTLSQQNSQLQQYIAASSAFVGDGRLDGFSVAIVAEHGVDRGVVKQTEEALRAANAEVPAELWLTDAWQLDSDTKVQDLESALGLSGSTTTVRDAALQLLVRRLTKAPPAGTGTTTTTRGTTTTNRRAATRVGQETARLDPHAPRSTTSSSPPRVPKVDTLTALEQAGFLSVTNGDASAFGTFPSGIAEVLVVTGDRSDFAGADLTASFVRSLLAAKVPTVVGAVFDPGSNAATAPKRGDALAPILDDRTLSNGTSTVDDLDLVQGRTAAVLSLSFLGSGSTGHIGHYGYGTGASSPLPPHA